MALQRTAGTRDDPIEISGTTTEEERGGTGAGLTTDSEPVMDLQWCLENGLDETPKTLKLKQTQARSAAAGPSNEQTPRAGHRKRGSISSSAKGKQRASQQIYPLPTDFTILDSDDDAKPDLPSSVNTTQRRHSKTASPRKPTRAPVPFSEFEMVEEPDAPPGGAPQLGTWENPETKVFSGGRIISSASENDMRIPSSSKARELPVETRRETAPLGSWENPETKIISGERVVSAASQEENRSATSSQMRGSPSVPTGDTAPLGSWMNPETKVFSGGRMVSASNHGQRQGQTSPGRPGPSMTSSQTRQPESPPISHTRSTLTSHSAHASPPPPCLASVGPAPAPPSLSQPRRLSPPQHASTSTAPTPGSWENPITFRPALIRPSSASQDGPNTPGPSSGNRFKRRPSPTSPPKQADLARFKSRRLSAAQAEVQNDIRAETGSSSATQPASAVPVRRLGPTWKTSSGPPTPPTTSTSLPEAAPVSADIAPDSTLALESTLETPQIVAPTPLDVNAAAQAIVDDMRKAAEPPLRQENEVPHFQPDEAVLAHAATLASTEAAPVARQEDSQQRTDDSIVTVEPVGKDVNADAPIQSDIEIVPLPSMDMDVEMGGGSGSNSATQIQMEDLPSAGPSSTHPDPSSQAVEHAVEQAVEDVREGVEDVNLTSDPNTDHARYVASRSPSIEEISGDAFETTATAKSRRSRVPDGMKTLEYLRLRSAQKRKETEKSVETEDDEEEPDTPPLVLGRYEGMSDKVWRGQVEKEAPSEIDIVLDTNADSPPSTSTRGTNIQALEDQLYASVIGQPDDPTRQPPEDRRGIANREFNTAQIDEWNRRAPFLTHNPALHRAIFEAIISEKELESGGISIRNDVDGEGAPPDLEFEYSNEMLYHPDVPDPEKSLGCDCDGPCDPKSRTCSCLKRQEAYFYSNLASGFAYDQNGLARNETVSIWECSETCGCPPSCMNRVIQKGRKKETKIEIFKTRYKGWGVRAKVPIPRGTFIGIYAGELITEDESEKRGHLYNEIGRTYLFDLDGWQVSHPPPELPSIDGRLAETANAAMRRAQNTEMDETEFYSAYSVDAFHYGYTRFFNHSCDPNLAIQNCYVTDFHPERPFPVIFARKDIAKNEEMCISYKGIPDDDEDVMEPVPVPAPKTTGKGKKGHKKSASVHVSHVSQKKPVKNACYCGTSRCDGKMFNL